MARITRIDRTPGGEFSALRPCAYGDEVMNAGWNPAVVAMVANDASTPPAICLDVDPVEADLERLLGRLYALAGQT